MPDRAKLFKSGGSQAVRLPKGYRFEDQDAWSRKFLDLAGSAPDFPYPEEPSSADPGPDFDA